MSTEEPRDRELIELLGEIRDNQRAALEKQSEQLAIARQHLERTKATVEESIQLQRTALARQQSLTRIAFPAIAACIGLIAYLVVRYF